MKVIAWTRHAVVCMLDHEDGGQQVATISDLNVRWLEKLWPDAIRRRHEGESLQALMARVMRDA